MSQLSIAQHGIWVTARAGAATAYHMPLLIALAAQPDQGALAEACRALVERHPLLGSAVRERSGVPHFEPAAVAPVLERAESVDEVVDRPFDLERGPLVRFALVGGRTLLVVAHHLVFDGHSKDLLVAELAALHAGDPLEPAPPAVAVPAPSPDALADAADFWTHRWHEPGAVALPGGTLRSRAAGTGEAIEFPLAITDMEGLTRFEVLVSTVHALLASYGNSEVFTALDLSTRTAAESGRIGCYVNELPIHSRPLPTTPFSAFAAELRRELREIYRHRGVPLSRAVPGLRPHAALAPVSISYRHTAQASWPGADVEWLAFNHSVRGALQLQVVQGAHGAVASLRYDPRELADPAAFAADLTLALTAVARDPHQTLGEIREFTTPVAPVGGDRPQQAQPLPQPAAAAADGPDADDPLVEQIRAIWEQILDLSPIDPHDDIFDLGGHSLTITQIIARMQRQLGVEISLDDFFDNSTIAGVVKVIRS
ncbi:condensation domain-containing protein [Streptacidiphilus sp. P02-A3a]|uniref:condensation domain-containing protein n=1 Tax=Streptacidiphilus sp. P02-A3a TaxID=2704468 RepID=UPI0015F8D343|nr:condensation domain-containing protein [Streptacidiphilus sp. P02-A3a]QMU69852.1 hypothetical protein GXP74_18145 [Streptacidiphilus sp. P02-A3a]